MPGNNKVELDVRLDMKELSKDFDKLEKEAKAGAKEVSESFDDMQESIEDTAKESEKSGKKMKNAAEKLIDTIRSQEAELAELKKAYLNTTLEQGKSSVAAKRLEEQIKELSTELDENKKTLQKAEYSADDYGDAINELGDDLDKAQENASVFGDVLKGSLASSAIEKGIEKALSGMQAVASETLELQNANKKLAASTGATKEEMQKYSAVMEELYRDNWGESIGDVADNMALVKQYTGEVDPSKLQELTESAMALDDTFENMDMGETIRGVDALMKNMGLSAEEAFDYIAAGAQKGLNKSGELTDNIAEYSQLWGQAGFSAEEMFAILDNGLSSGAYNLDKVNDFVKEFAISLSDGRIEDNLSSFSESTQTLFKQWQNGEAATKDVFYSIIGDLSHMTNEQEALTLASNVWSALGEDNAMKVITSLDDVNIAYKDVHGTMDDIKDVRYDTLESRIQQLGRKIMYDFVRPVGEKALPGLEKSLDAIIEHTDTLIPLTETAVAGLVAYKTVSVAITAYEKATKDATLAQTLLNTVMNANPAALVVAGIVAAGVALANFAGNIEPVVSEYEELRESARAMSEELRQSQEEMRKSQEETRQMVETSTASVEAMRPVAEELAALAKQGSYTNEEYDRMANLVTQLKTVYPEMGIEIDRVTGKLNMGSEEILAYVGNLENMAEADAYQQGMEQSIQNVTDAIKERTLAVDEYDTLVERNIELERTINTLGVELYRRAQLARTSQEDLNKMLEEGTITQEDYTRALEGTTDSTIEYNGEQRLASELISELTYEQEKNKETIEGLKKEIEGHNEVIKEAQEEADVYAEKYNELTAQMEAATAAEQANAEAVGESSKANITAAGQQLAAFNNLSTNQQQLAVDLTNSFVTMEENLQNSISSQLGLFDKLNTGAKTSLDDILEGLDSQITGVETWEQNLTTLVSWGIDNGLLQTLIDAGPETGAAVQAIVDAGEGEITKLNEKWALKESVLNATNDAGEALKTAGVESIAKGFDGVDELMKASGADTVRGLVEGIKAAQGDAEKAGKDLGVKTIDSTKDGLGTHSPSVKADEAGRNTVQGLVNGINKKLDSAKNTGKRLGTAAIDGLKSANMYDQALNVGKNFGTGLATGIRSTTDRIAEQAAATVRAAINAANAEQDAHSPAKETIKVGHYFGTGAEVGIRDKIPDVSKASADLMKAALSAPEERWAINAIDEAVYSRGIATGRMYYSGADQPNARSSGKMSDETRRLVKELATEFGKEVEGMKLYVGTREAGRVVRSLL